MIFLAYLFYYQLFILNVLALFSLIILLILCLLIFNDGFTLFLWPDIKHIFWLKLFLKKYCKNIICNFFDTIIFRLWIMLFNNIVLYWYFIFNKSFFFFFKTLLSFSFIIIYRLHQKLYQLFQLMQLHLLKNDLYLLLVIIEDVLKLEFLLYIYKAY